MDRVRVAIEELRGILSASGLSQQQAADEAGLKSHKTVSSLLGDAPNPTASSMHKLYRVAPPNSLVRAEETNGEFSRSRRIVMQDKQVVQFDPFLIRSVAASVAYGRPLEDDRTVFHIIEPNDFDIYRSLFTRWQSTVGVESGTDFTGTNVYDVPDPAIRDEFAADLLAVIRCLQPQFTLIRRQRVAVSTGEESDRSFTRVLMPRVGIGGRLEIVLIRRLQESKAIFSLFPQLMLGGPSEGGAHGLV